MLKPSAHNVQTHPLVEPNKMLLPPIHIKLGLMKDFVKAMDREGSGFAFLQTFPSISMEKIKAGLSNGPQKRELTKGPNGWRSIEQSWTINSLKIVLKFLENHRSTEYEKEIEEILKSFRHLRARMSVKQHFQLSHLDYVPRIVEIWSKWRVSALTKTFALWMWTFSLTAGAWNGTWKLPTTRTNLWKDISSINSFFVYFSVYDGTMWTFCKYISSKFSIICLIQENE